MVWSNNIISKSAMNCVAVLTLVIFPVTILEQVAVRSSVNGITIGPSEAWVNEARFANSRSCRVEIANYTPFLLYGGSFYNRHGHDIVAPPNIIRPYTKEFALFSKNNQAWYGTSAMFGYRVGNLTNGPGRVVVGFSIPVSFGIYNAYYMAKWVANEPVEYPLWQSLYTDEDWLCGKESKFKSFKYAKEGKPAVIAKEGVTVIVSMTNTYHSTLQVTFYLIDDDTLDQEALVISKHQKEIEDQYFGNKEMFAKLMEDISTEKKM